MPTNPSVLTGVAATSCWESRLVVSERLPVILNDEDGVVHLSFSYQGDVDATVEMRNDVSNTVIASIRLKPSTW